MSAAAAAAETGFTDLGGTVSACARRPWVEWVPGWRREAARVARVCARTIEQTGWISGVYCMVDGRPVEAGKYVPPARHPLWSIDGTLYALCEYKHLRHGICAALCTLPDLVPYVERSREPGLIVPELETAESWAVSKWNDALPPRDGQRVTVAALRAVAEMFDPEAGREADRKIEDRNINLQTLTR